MSKNRASVEDSGRIPVEDFVRVMREADRAFEKAGGSTRHYVNECLFPLMEREGMVAVRRSDWEALVNMMEGVLFNDDARLSPESKEGMRRVLWPR